MMVAIGGGAAYCLLAAGTIWLTSNGRDHAALWLADAVILALLLNHRRAKWPALLIAGWLGNLVANWIMRGWAPVLPCYGAINMAQVLFAALMLSRRMRAGGLLADARMLGHFVLWAGLVAPFFGALAGACLTSLAFGEAFWLQFQRWFLSNGLGLLVLTPFAQGLFAGDLFREWWVSAREQAIRAGLMLLMAAVSYGVFFVSPIPLLFLPFVPLLLIAFRTGRLGAQSGVMIVAVIGALATLWGHGPLPAISGNPGFQVFALQVYLLCLSLTTLPVAAVVGSRADTLADLYQRKESLKLVMANAVDVLLDFDATGRCQSAHGATEGLLGLSADALAGVPVMALDPDRSRLLGHAWARALASDQVQHVEIMPPGQPGTTAEIAFKAVRGEQSVLLGVVATIRDISDRKARELALAQAAETDGLTGIANRAGFERQLTHRMAAYADGPLTLALIDVDRFKGVNDSFGHQVGDMVLQEIAHRLKLGTRPDDLVGRLGGDEFVILFACGPSAARMACERIAAAIARTPVHDDSGTAVLCSISCGLATHHPGQTPVDLVREADSALYAAKREGRNRVRTAA
ncbi:diguanylate cyclase domain-containing protein [Sphingomonas sp. FW199]